MMTPASPPGPKQQVKKTYALVERRRELEVQLAEQERRAAEAEATLRANRHREQALSDICRRLEDVMHLRQQHAAWQLRQPEKKAGDSGADAATEQQQQPLDVPAVLRAVPDYCCTSHLLRGATPQIMHIATNLSISQWSELFCSVIYELTMVLELLSRQQDEQQPLAGRGQSGADAAAAACSSSSSSSDDSTALKRFLLRGSIGLAAVAMTLAGVAPEGPAIWGAAVMNHRARRMQQLQHAPPPPQQPQQQQMPHHAAAGGAQIGGGLLHHGADGCSQQPEPHQHSDPGEPPDHWLNVARRLNLTPDQAGYLAACGKEVVRIASSQHGELQRLFPLSCTPGLQVLAAEAQQQPQGGAAAAGAEDAAADSDGASGSIAAVAGCVSQMSALPAVLLCLIFDCLTLQQGAMLLVASYPWLPRPLPFTIAAGELLQQLQSQQQEPAAPLEVQQQHLQEMRSGWWNDLLRVLPAGGKGADAS